MTKIIKLREHSEMAFAAAEWFHQKWGIPVEAYAESIKQCINSRNAIPQWYLVMQDRVIIGGLGVIENDFHDRKDLTPNVCAVYVEEEYRCQGIAGNMLDFVCNDMREHGIYTLYLVTDHTSFYERYGWKFLCMVQGDGEPNMTRMYIHSEDTASSPLEYHDFHGMRRKLQSCIKNMFADDCSGHDYFHSIRVYKMAMKIAEEEICDKYLVMISALLHDVDDKKLFQTVDHANARKILQDCEISQADIERVIDVIQSVSYQGTDSVKPKTTEGMIVQDADRLDAMGAIGIARAFAYGGAHGRKLYDPEISPIPDMEKEQYCQHQGTTINHFYEKLLLLKEMLNTNTARKIAEKRQLFMEQFLKEFYIEWNGEG